MGSFRSTPELKKDTITKAGVNLTYSVTSMCGTNNVKQVGAFIWKMLILTYLR